MITFTCECGKRHQVKDELAGKRGKCSCGTTLLIPQSGTATQANAQSAAAPVHATVEKTQLAEAPPDTAAAKGPLQSPTPSILCLRSLAAFAVAALAVVFTKIVPANVFGDLSNVLGYTAAVIACLAGTAFLISAVAITVSRINKRRLRISDADDDLTSKSVSRVNGRNLKNKRAEIIRRAVAAADSGDYISAAAILEKSEMAIDHENAANCRNVFFGGSPHLADMCVVVLRRHLESAETFGG